MRDVWSESLKKSFIQIWIIELALHASDIRKHVKSVTWQSLLWFKDYFFAFMCLMIFMASIKNLVGSHRPFFFQVCNPNLGLNCTLGSFVGQDYVCTNTETSSYMLFESSRSFPSGHVIVSVYSCFFLMWYLQTRLSKMSLTLALVHLLCSLWIVVCSVTRITDHWHHLSDVIGGLLLSLPFVFFAVSELASLNIERLNTFLNFQCHVLCKCFKPRREKSDTIEH